MDTPFTFTNPTLNPWLLALDIVLILHALWSYQHYCLRRGYKLDLWHLNLVLSFVLPMMINFIFAGAYENRMSVWNDGVSAIQMEVDRAFLIHVVGYVCFHIGFFYYNSTRKRHNSLRDAVSVPVIWMANQYEKLSNNKILIAGLLVPTLFGGGYLLQQAGGGFRFDLRNLVMADGIARPIYGFCFQAAGPLLLTASIARLFRERTWINISLVTLMVLFEILSGTRSALLFPIGTLAAVYAVKKSRKLTFTFVLGVGAAMLIVGLALSIARSNSVAKTAVQHDAMKEFAYGNEYSDLRDFSWLLYHWDGELAYGKTYIAGALGFLPRVFFFTEFRDEWSFAPYTGKFLGLSSDHPGIRTGLFGEPYINFGYLGVIVVGLMGGFTIRYIDDLVKTRVQQDNLDMVAAVSLTQGMLIIRNISFSTAIWALYSVLLILATVSMLSPKRPKRTRVQRLYPVPVQR